MTDITQQQINCVFQIDLQVPIFDQDNWSAEEQQKKVSSKNITLNEAVQKYDENLMKKIDKEIENSRDNFFKVNVVKKQSKKTENNGLSNNSLCILGKKSVVNESKNASKNNQSLKKIQININQKNPNSVLKQGYMDKKTDSFLFTWKTRYFALTSEKLYFFQDSKKEKVVGCVNLKLMATKIKKQQQKIILDFQGQCQNLILQPPSGQFQSWYICLNQVITYNLSQQKLLLHTMIKPLYECQDSITQKQLNKVSETGDILLFYTRNTGAKIQRILTNSDFDHVAMIVKFRESQMMVFQSNQGYGVSVFDWSQYIRYFNLYEKVTLRKLCSPRKKQMHHTLLNFVKKNLGKKYDINVFKLLKLQSDFDWEKVDKQQARGFFCSELIAKAYKAIGIVDPKKSCGRYWPVDFSQKGNIQFKNGAVLGPQKSIILNRHIKNKL